MEERLRHVQHLLDALRLSERGLLPNVEELAGELEGSLRGIVAEAQEATQILDAILKYIPAGLIVADTETMTVRRCSAYGAKLAHKCEDELEGRPLVEAVLHFGLCHLDGTPAEADEIPLYRATVLGDVVSEEEWLLKRADGAQIPLIMHAGPIMDDEERLTGGVTAWGDISQRKKIEEALRESEENFRNIAENSRALLIVMQNDKIVYANPYACALLDYTQEELKRMDYMELVAPAYRDRIRTRAFIVSSGEREGPFEVPVLTRKEEERWLNMSSTRISYYGSPAFITIGSDSTEHKIAERELQKLAEELTRSNRDLEQFAYVASHDLQEPLRMIAAYLDLLQRRYRDRLDKDANEYIAFAVGGAHRMQNLIRDMLEYARAGERNVPWEPVSLEAVMDNVLMDLSRAIASNGAEVTYDPLPEVYGAKSQISQVLMNLIFNAIKFRGEEPPRVHVSARKIEGKWLFSVKDNGIGFSQEQAGRVFELFQRLHPQRDYAGTGLGLAICKKIVERHGGAIWVESRPGAGSTFYFTLPEKGD